MEFTFCEIKQWFNPGGETYDVLSRILVQTLFLWYDERFSWLMY